MSFEKHNLNTTQVSIPIIVLDYITQTNSTQMIARTKRNPVPMLEQLLSSELV